jgi:hydroxymethylglutaryl-CoA lyase
MAPLSCTFYAQPQYGGASLMPAVTLIEVGPRDGLQNESQLVPTDAKVAFIDRLSLTGVTEIEVSAFVSAERIPQLRDAEKVFERIRRHPGVRYTALVPNMRGLERAQPSQCDGIAVFTAASEAFARANINATIAESIERFRPVLASTTVPVRGYISTAFHCPFSGRVEPPAVLSIALKLLELGCAEVSIGDTIGRASPDEVQRLLDLLLPRIPSSRIAMHFHDTGGNAIANARTAAAAGVTRFEGSATGLGGCPFAPGAPGNVATEALAAAFPGLTGVDGDAVRAAAEPLRPYLVRSVAG